MKEHRRKESARFNVFFSLVLVDDERVIDEGILKTF